MITKKNNTKTKKVEGMDFKTFQCLARCNGADVHATNAPATCTEEFVNQVRELVKRVTKLPNGEYLVCQYSRKVLGQTGDGHFTPVGGYNEFEDMVLLFDVVFLKNLLFKLFLFDFLRTEMRG